MRIALFSGNYNYLREGANMALNRLVRYLEDSGCTVRVYSPVTATPAFEPAGTLIPVASVPLPVRSEFRLALGLPRAIRRDLRAFAPDLVHLSTPDILGTRAQTFALGLGVPVVASQHTRFETYLAYYRLEALRPLLERHLRRFYRRCDHVLVPTGALAEDMAHLRGDRRVSVWSRGIDTALFHPGRRDMDWRRAQGIADDETVALFFGRLVLEKGIATYVDTVARLARAGHKVRALAIGEGPARALFAELPGAVLTGHLDSEALARAVASADLLIHPSTTEAFGNVVTEAMACGLVPVCAEAQSARALVTPGHDGLICPAGDAAAFADATAALVTDPPRRAAMAQAALATSRRYTWDAASHSVLEAYRLLLAR
ncbi:glycosyltransferase family 4 protein [Novosphingobium colocasiae]|uniref:glycosyltransferase family 4 protein n=1 Tax=Novosphingobium colocasiae TaxID=1256513 RepID=UPI0035B06281